MTDALQASSLRICLFLSVYETNCFWTNYKDAKSIHDLDIHKGDKAKSEERGIILLLEKFLKMKNYSNFYSIIRKN